jgi:hypothetical protein
VGCKKKKDENLIKIGELMSNLKVEEFKQRIISIKSLPIIGE